MSETRYKSIDAVPKVIALGGNSPTQRFVHDVTNAELTIDALHPTGQHEVNELLRAIVKAFCDGWDADVLKQCNEHAPVLLVETMHRQIITGHAHVPEGCACRIEWAIGVYTEVSQQ